MNIKLNQKLIIERCGAISFKKGETFFRTNKVSYEQYGPDCCTAIVKGTEPFEVTIEKDMNGEIISHCTCPRLASFDRDCQHVAAVLLSIYEDQREGKLTHASDSKNHLLAGDLMTLFSDRPVRKSSRQPHFETRKVLSVEFTCEPVPVDDGQLILGIEILIEQHKVENIREFLLNVRSGQPHLVSQSFTFDSQIHCFQKEIDDVIQQLIDLAHDQKVYTGESMGNPPVLPISPTSWERILPLLCKIPFVNLIYSDQTFTGLKVTDERLPLQFDLTETANQEYQLNILEFNRMVIFEPYHSVLFEGQLYRLEEQVCNRLSHLKELLGASETNQFLISRMQISYFMEKVAPGLKRLGNVNLSKSIAERYRKKPLIAKLYLDRVKNRLLAGLEFHYEKQSINPLESKASSGDSLVIRDAEKEEEILQLMEESSFAKTEEAYFLHNEELEYEFLYHVLPKLQKLVQIYATTAVRNRVFRENTKPQIRVKVKKERTNWLEFKFEMDGISENQIREVLVALEEKRKYYRLQNGSLLSLETREWEEIQRFLYSPQINNRDLSNGLDLPIEQCLQLLDTVDVSNTFKMEESFRQLLANLSNPGSLEFAVPASLDPILRDYQKLGFQWMKTLAYYGFGGILADDMGLGKTLQSIAFILSNLTQIRENQLPALIVCPSSLTYNWLNEMMKFAPELQAIVIDGSKQDRTRLQNELNDIDVVVTSYPLLRKDVKWFENQTFSTIFFDEAQAFKNPITQTARAVKKLQAEHRFALTGTPIENSLEELWSIFHVVFPELFLGLKEYSKLTRKQISRRIKPFLLRRLKENVLPELPEKIEAVESVELFPEQKRLYAAYLAKLRHDTLKHLDKDTIRKNRIKILAGLTRLRQICCHPVLFVEGYKGNSAKFEQLMDLLEESRQSGRRVLLFSQFTKMLELIARELNVRNMAFFYLDGQTPSEDRVEICNRFNNGERDLFLISLKAGGTGLNLMGADTVILYDTWWNPAVEEQAADRAHRMGQKRTVQVIKLVARGTIEEKMNELQEKKKNLIGEIIDSNERINSALSEDDLRDLLMSSET